MTRHPALVPFLQNAYPSALVPFLQNAYPYVEQCFGSNPTIYLKIVDDPEIARLSEVVAYIQTSCFPLEAFERLRQLDELWFLEQLDRVRDIFDFNVEFV